MCKYHPLVSKRLETACCCRAQPVDLELQPRSEKVFRLVGPAVVLGKSDRNINADCRGHDFDRPRQLPHTKPTLCHTTGLCFSCGIFRIWEDCEEVLGVSSPMKGKAHCCPKKSSPVRRLYDMYIQHSTSGREQNYSGNQEQTQNSTCR